MLNSIFYLDSMDSLSQELINDTNPNGTNVQNHIV